jgi:hypothetical protein
MNDREHFLRRWSRRKQEAAIAATESAAVQPRQESEQVPSTEDVSLPTRNDQAQRDGDVDLKDLPSIDSITAATDIRRFLMPGVPDELRRAALRRAWRADPAIRDFVGLSENSWDFNNPEGLHGFGPLEMTEELRRIIDQALGRPHEPEQVRSEPPEATPAGAAQASPDDQASAAGSAVIPADSKEKNISPKSDEDTGGENGASRRDAISGGKSVRVVKVGGGGALPK